MVVLNRWLGTNGESENGRGFYEGKRAKRESGVGV